MPRRQAAARQAATSKAFPSPTSSDSISSGTGTGTTKLPSHIKKRLPRPFSGGVGRSTSSEMDSTTTHDISERRPLLDHESVTMRASQPMGWVRRNQWIVLALASGACAAFNGVFAKLTTTELTTSFSQGIAHLLHLDDVENVIEVITRAIFFGLNLVFNGVMWTLFTAALTRGNSTTQVSIINTSSNFVITAILGVAIFSESLPPMWWLGASMLVAGNVIIGRKDEGSQGRKLNDTEEAGSGSSSSSVSVSQGGDGEDARGTYHRVPGDAEPVFIPREEKDDEDVLDLDGDVDGTR